MTQEPEKALLTAMVGDAGNIAKVINEYKLHADVFVDVMHKYAYQRMCGYYAEHGAAPTWAVIDAEFPNLNLDHDVTEPVAWTVNRLKRRFVTNEMQRIMHRALDAAEAEAEVSMASMRQLAQEATDAADVAEMPEPPKWDPEQAQKRRTWRHSNAEGDRLFEQDVTEGAMFGEQAGDDPFARGYVDIAAMLRDGAPEAPKPTVLARTDGHFLFYRGEVNVLFGDPDSGKTWVLLCACAAVLAEGGRVLFIDLDHNGAGAIVARLLELGAPTEAVSDLDRCRVFTPEDDTELYRAVGDCVREGGWVPDLVGIDSVGELLPKLGLNSDSNDDFTVACQRVFYKFAGTGAGVVLIDHLAKSYDSRQFGQTGAGAKKRAAGGVQIRVIAKTPFRKGVGGRARLYVNKDRHGGVREHCPVPLSGKSEEWAGTFVLEDAGGSLLWTVEAPSADPSADNRDFRPTHLMEMASKVIEAHPGEFTRDKAAKEAGGTKTYTLKGIDLLFDEKYVARDGQRYPHYTSVKPYREADDPRAGSRSPDLGERLRQHAQAQSEEVPDAPAEG